MQIMQISPSDQKRETEINIAGLSLWADIDKYK